MFCDKLTGNEEVFKWINNWWVIQQSEQARLSLEHLRTITVYVYTYITCITYIYVYMDIYVEYHG